MGFLSQVGPLAVQTGQQQAQMADRWALIKKQLLEAKKQEFMQIMQQMAVRHEQKKAEDKAKNRQRNMMIAGGLGTIVTPLALGALGLGTAAAGTAAAGAAGPLLAKTASTEMGLPTSGGGTPFSLFSGSSPGVAGTGVLGTSLTAEEFLMAAQLGGRIGGGIGNAF